MSQATDHVMDNKLELGEGVMYVTMCIDNQMFGIEVKNVRDVLRQQRIIPIPLAPPEIAGSLNLRGRIVTVVNLRKRLNLPAKEIVSGSETSNTFVVVEYKGDLYSLIVDSVGEVLTASHAMIEKVPTNLNSAWKDIASGIYKLDGELLVLVNIHSLLKF
jgi:purine-binding chemotaxis protein CheW